MSLCNIKLIPSFIQVPVENACLCAAHLWDLLGSKAPISESTLNGVFDAKTSGNLRST